MNDRHLCNECGKTLPPDSAHGLCPACLMAQAMASPTLHTADENEASVPPPSPGEIADKFPQFEIVECLGRGGMGVVYKARQKSLDRWVAIKLLAPERVHDERFAEHFEREAKTLAKMSHPNIVTVFDHGQTGGLFYIVMEYVDGVNLRDLLRDGKMEPEQALAIVPPICEALEYAHGKGVVHRDIKPENLLLDREGRVKIADFGIASLVGATGEKSGTPPYMAPEQELGVVDRRADIYALGAVLYEMLTGERPTKDLVAPSKRVEVDVKIDEMVLRALEKEPERRYQTAGEFRTVVETIGASAPARNPAGPHGPFRRLWWLFLVVPPVCLLLGLAFGALRSYLTPKQYEAGTVIEISRQATGSEETGVIEVSPDDTEWISRLNTTWILDRVTSQLDLARSWSVDDAKARRALSALATFPAIPGTNLRELRIRHTDASQAAAIANAWAYALQEWCANVDTVDTGYSIVIHEEATPPQRPVAPTVRLALVRSAIAGLLLSPLLAVLLIQILHRAWLLRAVAIMAGAIAVLVLIYVLIPLLLRLRTGDAREDKLESGDLSAPQAVSETTPEFAARSFMEAMRDGDIDTAMAWMSGSPSVDEFPPVEDNLEWLREALQDLSDKLRQETYAGELEELTHFVQWLPELHDAKPRYIATRVAAPSDPDEQGMKNGIYLILVDKPEGWRVLSFVVGIKKSFEDSVTEFLQQRVLVLPVRPPQAMQENSPVTIGQVKNALNGVTWDSFLKVLSDRQGETISAREVAANGWEGRRHEVSFRLGTEKMLLDLLVDPAFRRAEPTHMRRAAEPGEGIDEASEFLPVLAYHYTIRTVKDTSGEALDSGIMPLADVRTMERYVTALDAYVGTSGSFPANLDELVRGKFFPSKRGEDPDSLGRVVNHRTGTTERPLCHVDSGIPPRSLDSPKFIVLAAPAPDRNGRRLVVTLGQRVRLIDEEDYQKQIAQQAKTAPPEQVARSFMEAIRDGDIDAATVWLTPEMKQRENFPLLLELSSKILRDEIYVGQLDRLTKFTEWSYENVDGTKMLIAARIAPPGGQPSLPVNHGAVLILTSTPDGWKVAEFHDGGAGNSLSGHLKGFLRQRVLGLPVSPPLTMPKDSPLTAAQAKDLLQGVTWGDILTAISNDGNGRGISVRQLTAGGGNGPLYEVAFHDGDEKILLDLRVDWQTRRAEPSRLRPAAKPDQGDKTSSEILPPLALRYAIQKGHPAVVDAGLVVSRPGPRQVELLDFDRRDVGPTVLDLASGELLEVPPVEEHKQVTAHFNKLGKGDLAWDVGAIITLRGAQVSEWLDDGWTLRNPERELDGSGMYRITVPTRVRISTAEAGHYIVDVREKIEGIQDGVRIEYRRSASPETGKNAPEAARPLEDKPPPEAAEIRRLVLGLPVQPPIAVPKDSPLTIEQVKEVLKGVTWGELLASLARDEGSTELACREVASKGEDSRRFEIGFVYGSSEKLLDLEVDPEFHRATPLLLRSTQNVGVRAWHVSEFLSEMVVRYAMETNHPAASRILDEAKAKERLLHDKKTLRQYSTVLMIYRNDTGSFPPDLATLLDGDFLGKKGWARLKQDRLVRNHQTGKMERPTYHGGKDLRANDHDATKFILLASPSSDPQGKRLVAHLDGSVTVIDEAEYQKQIQKQAKAVAPQPRKVKRLPPFFGELKLTESQEQAIQRWLTQQGEVSDPAKLADFVKSILRDDQQAAFQRIIEQGQQPGIPDAGIRVVQRTATQWVINYTSEKNQSLSLWIGTRDSAGFLWIPEGAGTAKLKATKEGLILETGAQKLGPMPLEAFTFEERDAIVEQDGSVIIGKCADGVVGIRVAKFPAKNGQTRGAELTPDFEQATRKFHFKAGRPSLVKSRLTKGAGHYLVIPVTIESKTYRIKSVNWTSRTTDGTGPQLIDLSLALEPSVKGKSNTSHKAIVGTTMNRKCQIRYANSDGTLVDLMTVDTGKLPSMPLDALAPGKDVRISASPDGTWLDDRKVSHEELADALKQLHPDTKILIEADPSLRHKEWMAIMEICRNAGKVHIAVPTKQDPDHE